jgi:hypothetical protein
MGDSLQGHANDDRLPWLETVEEEYRERRPVGRIVLWAALALLLVAAAGFGWAWYGQRAGLTGHGELIEAQAGDYKVKPDQPGGMEVPGEGDTVFATSQGNRSDAGINVAALPEAPVEGRRVAAGAAAGGTRTATIAVPTSARATATPAAGASRAAAPAPAAAAGAGTGSVIQLGAFPSEAGANTAWARLSKRFGYLAPLGKAVVRAEKDGQAIWRLRVNAGSNGQARELCGRLKVAGEGCFIAN